MFYAMLSMLRSIFPMCFLARSICFYACSHAYFSFLEVLCFMPCFPTLCSSFCSILMLGLHAYMLTCLYDVVGCALFGSMCFMCLFPCYMVRSMSSHNYMLGFMFFHVYVLGFYVFTCMFLCLYA